MPRDWQRIVFDNSPIYVKADAKGNRPSTLKMLKDFLRPSTTRSLAKKVLINVESKRVITTKLTGSGAVCRDPVECIVRQSFLLFNFFNLDV
jgi:hypothetical protein